MIILYFVVVFTGMDVFVIFIFVVEHRSSREAVAVPLLNKYLQTPCGGQATKLETACQNSWQFYDVTTTQANSFQKVQSFSQTSLRGFKL